MKIKHLDKYRRQYKPICFYENNYTMTFGYLVTTHKNLQTFILKSPKESDRVKQVFMLTVCETCIEEYKKKFTLIKFITKLTEKDIFYVKIT